MSVVSKFRVEEITKFSGKTTGKVLLVPVTGNDEENSKFWKNTPYGKIEMYMDNPEALKEFEDAEEFYVTFNRADEKVQG